MLVILAFFQAATGQAPAAVPLAPICPQIAELVPFKPPTATRKHWQFDTRGGIKGLFSGSVTTTFGAKPLNENDAAAWQRASQMCHATKKGGECEMEGPVNFFLTFDEKQFGWQVEPGEHFLFRVRGTILECEDSPTSAKASNVRG